MEGSFKIPNLPKNKPEDEKTNLDKSEQASESIYVEPEWAAVPKKSYTLTEIKTGCETAKWKLTKSCLKIGRSNSNDLIMLHNSVSRHHAVVQSGVKDDQEVVFLYDMGTTHGTFLNKTRIPPNEYIRLKDGYIFKFAGSTRIYLFEEDRGDDSNDQMTQPMGGESDTENNADEEPYVDWGIGDKDEASDPYSDRNIFAFNEDEELDRPDFDPIKALDLWFEQEGIRPSYKFEASAGNTLFQCSVTLPLEDITNEEEGNMTITGKADKKSIAKRQAALDCCKYLTNLGYRLVEKKSKNWEQNDYYDSDEDPFLDRTGDLEKKRALRKIKQDKAKTVEEFLTFEKLAEKHNNLVNRVLKEDTNFRNAMRHLDEQKKKYEQDETQKEMLSIIDRDIEKLITGHRARLTEIDAEIKQNEMLMQLAKPALPAIGVKDEVDCQKIDIQLYMPAVTKMNLGPSTSGVGVKSITQKTSDQRTAVPAREPDEWTDSPIKKRKITLPVKIVLKGSLETTVNEANKKDKEKSSAWKNEEK